MAADKRQNRILKPDKIFFISLPYFLKGIIIILSYLFGKKTANQNQSKPSKLLVQQQHHQIDMIPNCKAISAWAMVQLNQLSSLHCSHTSISLSLSLSLFDTVVLEKTHGAQMPRLGCLALPLDEKCATEGHCRKGEIFDTCHKATPILEIWPKVLF